MDLEKQGRELLEGMQKKSEKGQRKKHKSTMPPPVPISATKPAYASNQDKPTAKISDGGSFVNNPPNMNGNLTNLTSGDNAMILSG